MRLQVPLLAGAALAALLLAPSAFASEYGAYPTPQDRAATERSSEESLARARHDADNNAAARAQYEADQATAARDRARYEADSAAAQRARDRYNARYGDGRDYAHRWNAFYGHERFRAVMAMPSRDLVGLTVTTRGGDRVGRIRDIDSSPDGRVSRVSVSIGHGEMAWVDADNLRFDPDSRAVLTDLSRDQIADRAHMHSPRF